MIRCTSSRSLNLVEQVHCIANLGVELAEVVEVALDLFNGEINQHACDLGSSLVTHELLHILVDELTNETLVVGVLRDYSGEVAETLLVVGVDQGISVGERCLGTAFHACGDNLLGNGLNVNNWLLNLIVLSIVLHWPSVVVLISTLEILSRSSLLLVASIVLESALRSVLVIEAIVLERHAAIELLLHQEQNLLNELNGLRLLKNIDIELILCDLLPLIEEISPVLSLSLLLPANLGQLIVSDV